MTTATTRETTRRDRGATFALPTDLVFSADAGHHSKPDAPLKRAYFNSSNHNVINSQTSEPQTFQKPRRRKAFWEKLKEKNETKNKVCVLLSELREHELADKFRACSSRFQTTTCGQHIVDRKVTFHCGHRACPFCAEIRAKRLIADYLPKAEAFYKFNSAVTPCHLVLTQKHYQNECLSDSIKRLLSNFRKLIRRSFWKQHLGDGGMYAVEFTIGKDGCWHAHLHCLVFRRHYFHVSKFQKEWREVTGDSINFKIKKVDTLTGGIMEVCKYISKPMDVDKFRASHLRQVLDLKGQKMFSTFGNFRTYAASFEAPQGETADERENHSHIEGDACPHCQEPLLILSHSIGRQIELERFIAQSRATFQQPSSSFAERPHKPDGH